MNSLIQGTEEWLEFRRNKIGASDAPIILKVSPWSTPYQLWAEKLQISPPRNKTSFMNRGLDLEERARNKFESITDTFVLPQVVVSEENSWMIASLDGIDIDGKIAVEIKCPGKVDHQKAVSGHIPEKYYPQLQHQLAVCELDMIYYFSYDGENGILLKCYRNEQYIKNLILEETVFWNQLQDLEPPNLTEKDFDQKSDDIWQTTAGQYLSLTSQIACLEERQKLLKEQLIFLSQGKNSIGGGVQVTHVARRGSIDYSAIPELSDLNLEVYRKLPSKYAKISAIKY